MKISTLSEQSSFYLVLLATFATFCSFYAPQPLLPLFSQIFSVSAAQTALLITVTFVLLCVAPLAVGVILNHFTARNILVVSVALLGCLQIAFANANTYYELLGTRTLQAIFYPAIFTAAVTYASKAGHRYDIGHRVGLYIATTILGGLGGRLLSGFLTSYFNWSTTFWLLGCALLLCAVILLWAKNDETSAQPANQYAVVGELIKMPGFAAGLALIFTTFFAFSATLNALPFRMIEIDPSISPSTISMVYIGYVVCVFIAASTSAIASYFGGVRNAMRTALVLFIAALLLMSIENAKWLIMVGFATASGAFFIHASLNGLLVKLSPGNTGIINGLYISTYYFAGALGSIVPLWIYNNSSWIVFLILLVLVSATGFLSLSKMSPGNTTPG